MDFSDFVNKLKNASQELADSFESDLPYKVESAAMEFVDNNFANQGWEGKGWKESKGTILVKSGRLRSGFRSDISKEQVRIYNDIPYAKIHNEGYSGIQYVKPHKRSRITGKKGKLTVQSRYNVKGFSRKMNMPQRQFAPYQGHESNTLNSKIDEVIATHVDEILKKVK